MCELCDMPFMNYKEHINTKKHMRESQDENKFHELDELINERPLNVIFNNFEPEKYFNHLLYITKFIFLMCYSLYLFLISIVKLVKMKM